MLCRDRSPLVSASAGVLTLLLLQGVCVSSEETITAFVGESVELKSGYEGKVENAEWTFKEKIIAEVEGSKTSVEFKSQFQGRLEMYSGNFSLKVRKLTKADSGRFTFTTDPSSRQFSKTIQLNVYDNTLMAHVWQSVTLYQQNNTCSVILLCNASGPPHIEFSWSGYQTGNGTILRFPLSPAEGSRTITCTVVRGENKNSTTVTVECNNSTNSSKSDVPINPHSSPTVGYLYFVVIPAACGGLVLIVIIAVGVYCHRRRKVDPNEQNTVYADVTSDQNKNQISPTVTDDISIYEMVDERAIGIQNHPQTLYDQVNFSRAKKDVGPSLSSPYQEVL